MHDARTLSTSALYERLYVRSREGSKGGRKQEGHEAEALAEAGEAGAIALA